MRKKIFEDIGYDKEEHYFHKLNQELTQRQRELSAKQPKKNNVIQFRPRQEVGTRRPMKKAA